MLIKWIILKNIMCAVLDFCRKIGLKYFIVCDDDYTKYDFRIDKNQCFKSNQIKTWILFFLYIDFMDKTDIDIFALKLQGRK